MTPLFVVLGIVGAILILAGLVGGEFTLSGSFMPKVSVPKIGNWVRLPCFSVGAVLVVLAIGLGIVYDPVPSATTASNRTTHTVTMPATPTQPSQPPTPPATSPSPTPPATSPSPTPSATSPSPTDTPDNSTPLATGTIMANQGDNAVYVYQQPSGSSSTVAEVANGATVSLLCTVQGDVVTRSDNGLSSSLWDGTSDGYIPDVYVDTGTNQPTMGSC